MDEGLGDALPLCMAYDDTDVAARERYRNGYEAAVHDMMRLGLQRAVAAVRFQARWGAGRREWRAGYCDALLTGVQARMDTHGWLAHETLEWPEDILKRMQEEIA